MGQIGFITWLVGPSLAQEDASFGDRGCVWSVGRDVRAYVGVVIVLIPSYGGSFVQSRSYWAAFRGGR